MNDLSWVVLGTQPWSSARAQVVLAAELYFQPLFSVPVLLLETVLICISVLKT